MKVVIFCGGLGMRLREYSENIPKPMVPIGYRPVLWHLMKYYAHFGHNDFILCLGYRADVIKNYFLDYDECLSNDFVLSEGGQTVDLLHRDIADWRITFVDTGMHSNLAGRLMAVRQHLKGEGMFMANYADGLCDLDLNRYIDHFVKRDKIASMLTVKPTTTFHIARTKDDGTVEQVQDLTESGIRVNGGYFVLREEIFDHIRPGEELVDEPFQRLIDAGQLVSQRHDGFWRGMDTFKDKQHLDDLYFSGNAPWVVWEQGDNQWRDRRRGDGHR